MGKLISKIISQARGFGMKGCFLLALIAIFFTGCTNPEDRYQRMLSEVRVAIEENRGDEAIELLNQLNENFPNRAEVLFEMGRAHETIDERLFAAFFYEQAASLDEGYAESWLKSARIYERAGDTAQAMIALEEYLSRFPEDAEAWRFSAALLLENRRLQSALTSHMRAQRLEGPSPNPEHAVEIAGLYMELENMAQAETYYDIALEGAPQDRMTALLGQLTVYYRTNRFEEAESLIAILDEEYPGALDSSNMAATRENLRMWRMSLETIQRELDALAQMELEAGEIAETEESGRELEEGEPEAETGLVVDQVVLATDGMTLVEEDYFSRTDKLPPEEEVAVVTIEEVLEPPLPPPPPTLAERAREKMDMGQFEEAVQLYWRAVGRETSRADLWVELSRANMAAGQPDNAEVTILEAIRREPNNLDYTLYYLEIVRQARSQNRFVEELERAYDRFPNNPDLILLLARFYAEPGGNAANARYFYRQFLQMAPTHPDRAEAARELQAL